MLKDRQYNYNGEMEKKIRVAQSVAYPLTKTIDPVTLTFDLENK
jgi:hypothetical protein